MRRVVPVLVLLLILGAGIAWWATHRSADSPPDNAKPVGSQPEASTPVYFPVTRRLELRGNGTKELRVVATKGGVLRVTFRPPEGAALARPTMRLVPADGGDRKRLESLWVNPKTAGTWTNEVEPGVAMTYAQPIAAGRYTLEVTVPGLRPASVPVDVVAGDVADALVTLAKE